MQYTKDTSVTQVLENVLVIKPKIEINEENLRKPFDLKDGYVKRTKLIVSNYQLCI